jgi:hypothetical protein
MLSKAALKVVRLNLRLVGGNVQGLKSSIKATLGVEFDGLAADKLCHSVTGSRPIARSAVKRLAIMQYFAYTTKTYRSPDLPFAWSDRKPNHFNGGIHG